KSILLAFFLILNSTLLCAQVVDLPDMPERSLSKKTKVLELQAGDQILVTENLIYRPLKNIGNLAGREKLLGRWCYLANEVNDETIYAGTTLNIISDEISIDEKAFLTTRVLTVPTEEGVTLRCMG